MAQVVDVAAYILDARGPMPAMKLQKLVYYSQVWHLVWHEEALFESAIEAWANGPACRDLYHLHRGRFTLQCPGDIPLGDPSRLTPGERGTIGTVLDAYGDKPAHWLSELTHNEDPWRRARECAGLTVLERGNATISLDSMFEYYDGLTSADAEAV